MILNSRKAKWLGTVAVGSALAIALAGCGRDDGGSGGGDDGGSSPASQTRRSRSASRRRSPALRLAQATARLRASSPTWASAMTREASSSATARPARSTCAPWDDAYDPQKALQNFQQNSGDVFAFTSGLGTPTNRAYRDAAIDEEVPQVLVQTGDPIFSDQAESPWQLGFVPTYMNEGAAFGELLAESGDDLTVAILSQNDDYGEGYVEGFMEAIDGTGIEVVSELAYEATDTSVDAS